MTQKETVWLGLQRRKISNQIEEHIVLFNAGGLSGFSCCTYIPVNTVSALE
jgi:hypothetical protein